MMRRSFTSIVGVTLLEIMLVLAVAALVVVMSVRYYQAATVSQQSNLVYQQNLNLIAAMDNLAQGTGNFGGLNTANLTSIVGSTEVANQWGGAVTIAIGASPFNTYTLTETKLPLAVCIAVSQKLKADSSISMTATPCTVSGSFYDLAYTYDKTK